MLFVQPTVEMGLAWSKDRLAPMIRDTKVLRDLVKTPKSKDSGNTLLHKTFPGGHLTIAGANAPSGLAMRPVRLVLCDEVDRYPMSAGSEGDPVYLAAKRSQTFWNRKLLMGSTPTVKGVSRIEQEYELSDQRRFYVPCPHCQELQTLKWKQVQWPKGKPEAAYYACEHCGAVIHDTEKQAMLSQGQWIAEGKTNGVAGFHINELYSPWSTFGEIAAAFIKAKDHPATLQTWVNTALGETFEEEGETVEAEGLLERREQYETLPEGVLILTAGVDIQADRIEIGVDGWGLGEESWGVEKIILYGDPDQAQVWADLDEALQGTYLFGDKNQMHITGVCIDSGYKTQFVYDFVKSRRARRIYAIKGVAGQGRPIVSAPTRKKQGKNSGAVELFSIGVDGAKAIIYSRLRLPEPGPGYCHFHQDYDEEHFLQLTAEKLVTKYRKGFPYREWQKTRPRNEALDLRVYSYAALKIINPSWQALANRSKLQRSGKVASGKPKPKPTPPSTFVKRPRGSFFKR